jgi:hypothetical protein
LTVKRLFAEIASAFSAFHSGFAWLRETIPGKHPRPTGNRSTAIDTSSLLSKAPELAFYLFKAGIQQQTVHGRRKNPFRKAKSKLEARLDNFTF